MAFQESEILRKIEEWADKLPYRNLKVEIELSNKTYTLEKSKPTTIGFSISDQKR